MSDYTPDGWLLTNKSGLMNFTIPINEIIVRTTVVHSLCSRMTIMDKRSLTTVNNVTAFDFSVLTQWLFSVWQWHGPSYSHALSRLLFKHIGEVNADMGGILHNFTCVKINNSHHNITHKVPLTAFVQHLVNKQLAIWRLVWSNLLSCEGAPWTKRDLELCGSHFRWSTHLMDV